MPRRPTSTADGRWSFGSRRESNGPAREEWHRYRRPAVPADLIRYTDGQDDFDAYLRGGFEVATMFDLALRKHFGKTAEDFGTVLDFGCGTGRVSRFLSPGDLHGCDVNAEVIRFCKQKLPSGSYVQSPLLPPLPYPDETFDLVVSFSVFSHLRQDVEEAWLQDLRRVGRPGCVYLISVQGDWMIENTLGDEADAARSAGFYFRPVHQRHQIALDFPEYYESSYHTSTWLRQNWSSLLEVVDVIRGDDPSNYLPEGLAFAPTGDIPAFRPMGQDLVVARR